MAAKTRPKHLDLPKIRLPLPGIVSILHRVSGAGLFLMIPLLLWLFQKSLGAPEAYAQFQAVSGNLFVKLILFGLVWAFMHHLCAGVRYLLLDLHWGIDLDKARASSKAVLGVSIVLTLLIGARLW